MIKFITEEYLRNLYREEAFDTYKLKQGQRLTPGAKEYLSDKRIKLIYDSSEVDSNDSINKKYHKNSITKSDVVEQKNSEHNKNNNTEIIEVSSTEIIEVNSTDSESNKAQTNIQEVANKTSNVSIKVRKKLYYKLKSVESLFLVTSNEVLKIDIILAQNIVSLSRRIGNLKKFVMGKSNFESIIILNECSKINSCNITDELDDCFEITEFHMQLEKGSAILKMHSLRCALQELQCEIDDIYEDINDEFKDKVIKNINGVINLLSQLICTAVGGKECQRRN